MYKYVVRADYTTNFVCKVLEARVKVLHLVDCEILTKLQI